MRGCCTVAVQADTGLKWKRLKPLLMWLETLQNQCMVAHTGFEPVISALRGRCPRPLDECASCIRALIGLYHNLYRGHLSIAFWLDSTYYDRRRSIEMGFPLWKQVKARRVQPSGQLGEVVWPSSVKRSPANPNTVACQTAPAQASWIPLSALPRRSSKSTSAPVKKSL
jgi:hypothetical protein